jgi:hypothetical protein
MVESVSVQLIFDAFNPRSRQTPGLNALPSVNDLDYNSSDDEDNDFVILRRQIADGFVDNDNCSEPGDNIPDVTQPITIWNENSPRTPSGPRRSGETDAATPRSCNDSVTPVHPRHARVIQNTHQTSYPGTRRPSGVHPAEPPQMVSPRAETSRNPRNVQTSSRRSPGTCPIAYMPMVAQDLAQASALALSEMQGSSQAQRRLHRSQASQFVSPGVQRPRVSQSAMVDDPRTIVAQNALAFTLDAATWPSRSPHLHRSQTLQSTQPSGPHSVPAVVPATTDPQRTLATLQDPATPSPGARVPLQSTQQGRSQVRNNTICQ